MSNSFFGKTLLLITFLFISSISALAADDLRNLSDMSLEELMNVKVTVATKSEVNLRESPGIVTSISSEDIRNSGARDLDDILTLFVPGFQLANDVEVAKGPAIRGIYAIEGKVLLLIDGIEANDDVWGNILFQNHYPADLIDHIEVIRGPGSAIYGSYASLGVISVTTKGAKTNGFTVSALNSEMKKGPSHRDLTMGYGKEFNQDFSASLFLTAGTGNSTDSDYTNYFFYPIVVPTSYPGTDGFSNRPLMVNGNVKYKNFDARVIVDLFEQGYPSQKDKSATDMEYSYLYDFKYNWKVSDKLTIIPRYNFKLHKPYNLEATGLDPAQNYGLDAVQNHRDSKRSFYGVTAQWTPESNLNIVRGLELYETTIFIGDGWFHKKLGTVSSAGASGEEFRTFPDDHYVNVNKALYTQGT